MSGNGKKHMPTYSILVNILSKFCSATLEKICSADLGHKTTFLTLGGVVPIPTNSDSVSDGTLLFGSSDKTIKFKEIDQGVR